MEENTFEGSIILELLAEQGLVDDFFEAIDSDDIGRAIRLMRKAQVDEETIEIAVKKMRESDGSH